MKHDEAWEAWRTRRRDHPPPAGLTDHILARVEQAHSQQPRATRVASSSGTLAQRIAPFLLWSAAAVVCAARVYSTVGLLVPGFAFAADPDDQEQGTSHVELAASGP
jgi:hypothetical protein